MSPIDYSISVTEREIKKLELQSGHVPFDDWFDSLRDWKLQAGVDARLARVRAGNFGDCKSLGAGLFELRIALGPGLRLLWFAGSASRGFGGRWRQKLPSARHPSGTTIMATIYKTCA